MPPPPYSLRPATSGDAPFLAEMVVAAVNWDPAHPPASRERVLGDPRNAHYVDGWPRAGDLGLVAVDADATPVGAAWLRRFAADDPGYGFVAEDVPEVSLGVVAGWRGRGAGRALLRALLEEAAAAGVRRVSLSVERENRARGLYVAEGFVVVHEDRDADTMLLDLGAAAPLAPEPSAS